MKGTQTCESSFCVPLFNQSFSDSDWFCVFAPGDGDAQDRQLSQKETDSEHTEKQYSRNRHSRWEKDHSGVWRRIEAALCFRMVLNNASSSFWALPVSWSNVLLQPGNVCWGMKASGLHPAWPLGGHYSRMHLFQKNPLSTINNAFILTWTWKVLDLWTEWYLMVKKWRGLPGKHSCWTIPCTYLLSRTKMSWLFWLSRQRKLRCN